MKPFRALLVVALFGGAVSCGDGTPEVATRRDVGPSPLLSFDPDRLWILLKAIDMGNVVCDEYYQGDTDLRAALEPKCGARERRLLAYLRLNGVPNLEPEHLAGPFLGDFVRGRLSEFQRCRDAIPAFPLSNIPERRACDPWDDATVNRKETPQSLGIVFPPQ